MLLNQVQSPYALPAQPEFQFVHKCHIKILPKLDMCTEEVIVYQKRKLTWLYLLLAVMVHPWLVMC